MGIEEFADMLSQQVTIEPFIGNDGYGEPQFGDSVEYPARVVGKNKMIIDMKGEERLSTYTVYLQSTANISPNDRITLPSGLTPDQPPIIGVGSFPDEDGVHHTVVYLQ